MFSFTLSKPDGDNHYVMCGTNTFSLKGAFMKLALLSTLCLLPSLPFTTCPPVGIFEATPIDAINVRRAYYPPISKSKLPKKMYPEYDYDPTFLDEDSFSIEPGDALTNQRYSPPAHVYRTTSAERQGFAFGPKDTSSLNHKEVYVPAETISSQPPSTYPYRKYPQVNNESIVTEATVTSNYKVNHEYISNDSNKDNSDTLKTHLRQNNFTTTNESHVVIGSDTVLSYRPPPVGMSKPPRRTDVVRIQTTVYSIPNSTETDISIVNRTTTPLDTIDIMLKDAPELPIYNVTDNSDSFNTVFTTETVFFTTDVKVTLTPTMNDTRENISDVSPPVESTKIAKFSSGAVAGIVIAVLTCVTVVTSSVIYLLYRKYNGNCTGVVESKFNSDNCGYLDDSIRSSVYLNNHIELPKENSEEMTSLDNDSFLNSLETMTIQNYWADNTKNTKV